MATETRSVGEIRQEIEGVSRTLDQKQRMLLHLYKGSKQENGLRVWLPHEEEQRVRLEQEATKLSDQLQGLHTDYKELKTEEEIARRRGEPMEAVQLYSGSPAPNGGVEGQKNIRLPETLGDAFVNSANYKSWNVGAQNQHASIELPVSGMRDYAAKATFTTAGATVTGYDRPPGVVVLGQEMLTIADLFSQGQTSLPTIRYIKEDTFTNAADSVAEGAAKPEASWDTSEVDVAVRKIAVIAKVTDELFADFPSIRSYINDRLPFMVRQKEELLLLTGDGVAPNILGILETPGTLTQARGTDTNVDAIYKGITKVRSEGFYEPDAVVIDPTNWTPIRILKTTTGEYVWGAPSVVGPETIFGKRVVVTANMLDNTALVGAFRIGGTVYYRQGLRVEATNSNEDDFEKNLITLRAEQREALVTWRPTAFCEVTGLTT